MNDWQKSNWYSKCVHNSYCNIPFYFLLVRLISYMCVFLCAFAFNSYRTPKTKPNEIKKIEEKMELTLLLLSIYSNRGDKILIRDVWKLICMFVCMCPFGAIRSSKFSFLIGIVCIRIYYVLLCCCFEYQFLECAISFVKRYTTHTISVLTLIIVEKKVLKKTHKRQMQK